MNCIHCCAKLPGRRKACDDCQVVARRARERRRANHPARPPRLSIVVSPGASTEERFWAKVDKTVTCWLWLGGVNGRGYGQFRGPWGATVKAHRFAYELLVGPIGSGLQLDHLCGVKDCVRPEHLEPVTAAENDRRAREMYRPMSREELVRICDGIPAM